MENISEKENKVKEGKVLAINISDKKGVVKEPVKEGYFIKEHGLQNDAHAGSWHRQVSLLANESVDTMRAKGANNLKVGIFAENITTEGLNLWELPIGTTLKIGESIQSVTQIGKECHHGCAIKEQVGECVMPTQGIFTKIIKSGKVIVGDKIQIISDYGLRHYLEL